MRTRPALDRTVFWLGLMSLVVAVLSLRFAWDGGLWALPLVLALATSTWLVARRRALPWRHAGTALAAAALLVGGYAVVSSGGVQPALRSNATSYQPGDEVGIRLRAGIRPFGYNLCSAFARLEHHRDDRWQLTQVVLGPKQSGDSLVVCTAEMRSLSPLTSARSSLRLPEDLGSGTYRILYNVDVGDEQLPLTTSDFTVE